MSGESLERFEIVSPASSGPTLVRQHVEHPKTCDVGVFFKIMNEKIDLFREITRLLHHLAQFCREVIGDGLTEILTTPKMLVGRTAIQARSLGNGDDGEAIGTSLREEFTRGRDQGLVRSLCVASERALSGARLQIPLREMPRGVSNPLVPPIPIAHFGLVSDIIVVHIKTIISDGLKLACEICIAKDVSKTRERRSRRQSERWPKPADRCAHFAPGDFVATLGPISWI